MKKRSTLFVSLLFVLCSCAQDINFSNESSAELSDTQNSTISDENSLNNESSNESSNEESSTIVSETLSTNDSDIKSSEASSEKELSSEKLTSADNSSNSSQKISSLSSSSSSVLSSSSSLSSSQSQSTSSSSSSNIQSSSSSFSTSYDYNSYSSYYSSINLNATGDSLVKSLGNLLENTHNPKSYDALWDGYILGDLKPGTNYLWDMYSNCNYDAYNPKKGNYKKEGDAVNREHSIPQSWFNEASPMKSDYYHVVPTDGYVNNRRSNYPLAEVGSTTYVSENGSKLGQSKGNNITGTVFEPIDEYKGDFARIYFYMCTRYYSKVGSWSGGVFKSSYPYMQDNYFNLYLKWAKQDPVSDKERQRNEGGYIFQGNRNPYVDYEELLYQAFDTSYKPVEKTDQEKANDIITLIDKIGDVTLSSSGAINAARTAYNNATESVKILVTNYDVLVAKEAEYKELISSIGQVETESVSCVFINKELQNHQNMLWSANNSTNSFEDNRGVQFLRITDLTLTSTSFAKSINQISIIASSNDKTYTFEVSVNGINLESSTNTLQKENNKELTFISSKPLVGEIKIHITTPSANKSLWIKSININ